MGTKVISIIATIFNSSKHGGHKKTTTKQEEETMRKFHYVMATTLMVALLLTIGGNAMAQETDTSAADTDAGVDTDTDQQAAPDNTGLLQMDTSIVYRYAYPLGLNSSTFNACDYFKGGAADGGFLAKVMDRVGNMKIVEGKGKDKVQTPVKDILGNFSTTGANAVCSLGPVTRQKLWDGFHTILQSKGCNPEDPSKINELGTSWTGTCGDIKSQSKAIAMKAKTYVEDPEVLALMDAAIAAAENVNITSGLIKLEILWYQMAIFMAPDEVWQPIFAANNVELGTLTDPSALKVDTTVKAVCVGKKPVVGKVVSNGDKLTIKTADGKTVEVNAKDCATWVANSFPTVHDGLEVGNKVVVLTKDNQLPTWGKITDVVFDASGKPTNIKVELEDGSVSDIQLTTEQILLGKAISSTAGAVVLGVKATTYVGVSDFKDINGHVVAPVTTLVIRWYPEALKGVLGFNAEFGVGVAEGNTTYGLEDTKDKDRVFFMGKVGASAGYDISWFRPEVVANLIYTNAGIGGEGGVDLVFTVHKNVKLRAGCTVGWFPTGITPDTRPGRNTPHLDGLFVGPSFSIEFFIPY